jgi:GGDEF domain-containing protein
MALRKLADTLRVELRAVDSTARLGDRAVDSAARFGGDEFVIILPQANTEGALLVAERLRSRIEEIHVPGFGQVTSSFGVATFPYHASTRDTLVVAADRALYISKNSGRNRVSAIDAASFAGSFEDNQPSVELVDAVQGL